MPLLNVVLTLVVVGVVLWLINTYIPMHSTFKTILNAVVVIVVVLWLLYGFGIISGGELHMPVVSNAARWRALPPTSGQALARPTCRLRLGTAVIGKRVCLQ